jgi:hypothetical protein
VTDEDKADLVRRAERYIVEVVEEWGKMKPWTHRELTELEQKLKNALWDLERAKRVTGQVKMPGGE